MELVESGVELPPVLFGGAGVDDDGSGEYTVFAGVSTVGCDAGSMCARHDGARSLL